MNLPSPLSLSMFSTLDDVPGAEIAPLVERATTEADSEILTGLTDLLLDRALRLLREGSRQEILDEALAVSQGISGEAGRALRERSLETYGAWAALSDLLGEAARRSDRAAVPSLLRSTQGHGLAILELLAGEGRALPRAEIRRRLSLGEAHLSHLLRDLAEADLIVRYRLQGSREVLVDLGRVGKEEVARAVLPPWLERLVESLATISAGSPLDAEALAQDLHEAGAPSRLAADRLAEAVARLAPAAPDLGSSRSEPDNVLKFTQKLANQKEDGAFHFQEMLDLQGGQRARSLFETEDEPALAASS